MPHLSTDDGVNLYYGNRRRDADRVRARVAGDCRSWEPQARHFARRYRCIAFNARGWPPSDVSRDAASYSQARACDDICCVLDQLKIDNARQDRGL